MTLSLSRVVKRFAGFQLGPLSCTFLAGRSYGLLGPNGAGKTTLLNLIAQQARLTSGEIACAGAPVRWGDRAWKERVAYIRETPSFYSELTVEQTVRFACRLCATADIAVAGRLLDRLDLRRNQRVGSLSKGNLVKLGLVTALARRTEFLVLDEPTAGLDPTAREELHQILRSLPVTPSPTLILSSHLFEDLEAVVARVLVLRDGQLVVDRSLEDLRALCVLRLPADADVPASDEIAFTWRRDGCRFVALPREGALAAALRDHPRAREEERELSLRTLYHGTRSL